MKWLYLLRAIAEFFKILLKKKDQEERKQIEDSIKENPRAFFERGNPNPSDDSPNKLHTDTKE